MRPDVDHAPPVTPSPADPEVDRADVLAPVSDTIVDWASTRNFRALVGVFARVGLTWTALGLFSAALLKAPDVLKRMGGTWPKDFFIGPKDLPTVAWSVAVSGGVLVLAFSVRRYLRRRTDAVALARALDKRHATDDLLVTTLAVELDPQFEDAALKAAVVNRARTLTSSLKPPIPRYRPAWGYGGFVLFVAAVAAVVLFTPKSMLPRLFGEEPKAEVPAEPDPLDVKLSKEEAARLESVEKQLEQLENQKGLKDSAKKKLSEARKELRSARKNNGKSAGHLSAAERALQDLADQARDEGGLFDPPNLATQSDETITKQLAEAIQRGDSDTASAMAAEVSRRAKEAGDTGMKMLGERLKEALSKSSNEPSDVDPKDLQQWRDLANKAGDHLKSSEPGAAKSKLREMLDEMDQKRASALDQSLSQLGDIRSKQLQTMNQQRQAQLNAMRGNADPSSGQQGQQGQGQQGQQGQGQQGQQGQGQQGQQGQGQGQGQQGQGQGQQGQGQGQQQGQGQGQQGQGQGQQGQGQGQQGQGQGQQGQGQGQQGQGQQGQGQGQQGQGQGQQGQQGGQGQGQNGQGQNGSTDGGSPGSGGVTQGGSPGNAYGDPKNPFGRRVPTERVRVAKRGPLPGSVGAIRRYVEGDEAGDYGSVHREYEAIAEGTMRSESIPLTRRDYIRHYFEAVRPQ